MVGWVRDGDFVRLQQAIHNPSAPDAIRCRKEDLEELFPSLCADFGDRDWFLLSLIAAFHDLGKLRHEWASQCHLCLEGVEWLTHDYDSEIILKNNPRLLEPYELSDPERELVVEISRVHSLPGQFFFGEGNLTAYKRVQEISEVVNGLRLARIHGVLDVMSALNDKMVRPILKSHLKLHELLESPTKNLDQLLTQYSVSEAGSGPDPIARLRLNKLVGKSLDHSKLEFDSFQEFAHWSQASKSWYGTYVANALGSGLLRNLPAGVAPETVANALMRVVNAACHAYKGPREEFAVSVLQPALSIVGHPHRAELLLQSSLKLDSLEGAGPWKFKAGQTGVALEFQFD